MNATTLTAPALDLPAPYGSCPFSPPPAYTAAAREAAVTRAVLPDGTACWLVTGYDEVRAVLADARFSADARTPGFPFLSAGQRELATAKPSFIRMDDPEHARLRRMVTAQFAIKRVETLRPAVQKIVDDLIDEMLAGPRPVDLVEALALPLPSLMSAAAASTTPGRPACQATGSTKPSGGIVGSAVRCRPRQLRG